MIDRDELEHVRREIVARLSPKGQVIYHYLFDKQLADRKVAEILGMTEQAVANRRYRIRVEAVR